jgi:hypothetical protein
MNLIMRGMLVGWHGSCRCGCPCCMCIAQVVVYVSQHWIAVQLSALLALVVGVAGCRVCWAFVNWAFARGWCVRVQCIV